MPSHPNADIRAAKLEFGMPDYANPPYGARYGTLKAFHRSGPLLLLSGITPEDRDGTILHPGRLGDGLTVDQGCAAARKAAVNALGMITLATGSLSHVRSIARCLNFIVAATQFREHHLVGEGTVSVFMDVFGEAGHCGRADIGASSLSNGNCFEMWLTVELDQDAPVNPAIVDLEEGDTALR